MIKFIKIFIAAIIFVPILLLCYIPMVIALLFGSLGKSEIKEKIIFSTLHFIARVALFSLGGKLITSGLDNIPSEKNLCFIGNHTSILDVVLLSTLKEIRTGFIGKIEVKKIPIVSTWFNLIHSVYIDRKSPRNSLKAILDGCSNIKNGYAMTIFPEGTRSKTGNLLEFKAGSFKMATKANAIICPFAIYGARDVFESAKSLFFRKIYISFLPPINTATLSEDELKELHTNVESSIRSEVNKLVLSR